MKKYIPDSEIWNCELVKPCNEQLRTLEILEVGIDRVSKMSKTDFEGVSFHEFFVLFLASALHKVTLTIT